MSSPNKSVVGIICGGGDYPRLVARACVQKDIDFCLVFLNGFCNEKNWPSFKNISINLGEIEKAINFLVENKVKKIVFAGGVKRPKFNQLSLDEKGKSWLMKLGKAVFSGDDTLLKSIAKLLEKEGFEVISGTSLLEDIFFPEGIFSRRKPSKSDYTDIKIGLSAARELGILDLGQSVVVHNGEILGKEDNDGTNALLEKCGRRAKKGGILVKVSKPQQDDRLDLPTIGVETIQTLHKNGFDGIIVEADRCIVINKKEVVRQANELNVFIGAQKIVAKKIFMIAGEASGDYLGGKLMQSILQLSPDAEFYGVGGEHMRAAGLKELFSINRLSIIGIFEVIGKLFSVKKMIDGTVKAIHKRQPDVVVTIDSSGFTHRVAKKVKKIESRIPIIHYVAPPVWAWRPWRAKSMHKFIDKLMVLFPFERQYFIGHGLETVFVGHPIATDPDFERPQDSNLKNFLNSIIKNRDNAKIVTILPGSRTSEIIHHMPVLEKVVRLMAEKYKNIKFIIPTIENLASEIRKITAHWEQKPIIVTQKSQKILSYYSSNVAIAASGTVALELARVGLPFVVIYKISAITYFIVKFLIRAPNVCLINILAKRYDIVPELLQEDCTAENIFRAVENVLSPKESQRQKKSFHDVMKVLRSDPLKAAREVLNKIC